MNRVTQMVRWLSMLLAAMVFTGCASVYVDGNAPEVPAAQFKRPAVPQDVQLIWEFQTKGVANARATELLKARVRDQVAASGLFTNVGEAPASSKALLSITVNNVPLSDDAAKKGFVAGLTFGIAGQTVGDGYEGTVRYLSGRGGAAPVVRTGKHVIYTSIGNTDPPPGAQKLDNIEAAVTLMLRQLLSRTLNDLSKEVAFP